MNNKRREKNENKNMMLPRDGFASWNFFVATFVIESSLTHPTTNVSGSLTGFGKKIFIPPFTDQTFWYSKNVFNKSADLEWDERERERGKEEREMSLRRRLASSVHQHAMIAGILAWIDQGEKSFWAMSETHVDEREREKEKVRRSLQVEDRHDFWLVTRLEDAGECYR